MSSLLIYAAALGLLQTVRAAPATRPAEVPPTENGSVVATEPAAPVTGDARRVTDSGLTIVTLAEPDETSGVARPGDLVWVHYTGRLEDGTVFDSSVLKRGDAEPIVFPLGAGRVIAGWDEGIVGMRVGERRQLVIPPDLAYGPTARPGIPADSTLLFDVQLVGVYGGEMTREGQPATSQAAP